MVETRKLLGSPRLGRGRFCVVFLFNGMAVKVIRDEWESW